MLPQDFEKIVHHLNITRILVVALIVSLIIGIFGLALNQRKYSNNLLEKEYQINALIGEVGELKDDNFILHNAFSKQNAVIEGNIALLDEIIQKVGTGGSGIALLKSEFSEAYDDYYKMFNKREDELHNLKKDNEELKKVKQIFKENQHLISILAVGTNQKLTDTIMLIIINPENQKIVAISIPRDLYVNGRKINAVYALYGIESLKKVISDVTGIYADKFIIVDFEAFEEVIDLIEGIDIYVKEDIYDPKFPNNSNGYTVYSIKKGYHHLDGKEALQYARSRKSTSDFDRAKRQQDIVQAIRIKLKTFDLLNDLTHARDLFNIATSYVETNITIFEGLYYFEEFQNYPIQSGNVIDTSNFLYATNSTKGEYILLPNAGDYSMIQKRVAESIKK